MRHTTMRTARAGGMTLGLVGVLLLVASVGTAEAKSHRQAPQAGARLVAAGAGFGHSNGSSRVRALQRRLHRVGEDPGPVDGLYGPLTEAAVRSFQGDQGLAVDGVVGPRTRAALRSVATVIGPGTGYGEPHGAERVRVLQRHLRRAGEHPGPVDGLYGPLTEAAVERFQARKGLAVDGIVGQATAATLARFTAAAPGSAPVNASGPEPRAATHAPHEMPAQTAKESGLGRVKRHEPRPAPSDSGLGPFVVAGLVIGAALLFELLFVGAIGLLRHQRRGSRAAADELDQPPGFQVRIQGSDGKRVTTAAELLSVAALVEGRHALAFPTLRSDAVGRQAVAFCRIDRRPIRAGQRMADPNGLIVGDPALLRDRELLEGLKPGSYLLINSPKSIEELGLGESAARLRADRRLTIPASALAQQHLGLPVPDAALVGGFAALTQVVSLDSVTSAIRERFPGPLGDADVATAEVAFQYVRNTLEGNLKGGMHTPRVMHHT